MKTKTRKKIDYKETLNPEQKEAFDLLERFMKDNGNGMFLLKGYAGTGKTYMITKFISAFMEKDMFNRVALTAPTNKAVSVLKEAAKGATNADFKTIYKLLGLKRKITNDGKEVFIQNNKYDVEIESYHLVVIDEVSMLDDALFKKIKKHTGKVKIVFMGDPAQIPPVNKIDCIPFTEPKKHKIQEFLLEQIMRQKEGSDIIGTSFYIRENLTEQIRLLKLSGNKDVKLLNPNIPKHKKKTEQLFRDLVRKDGFSTCKVIAWRNKTVAHYNKYIRDLLYGEKIEKIMLGEKMIFNSPYVQDRMILIDNSQEVKIKNIVIETETHGKVDVKHYLCEAEWYDIDVERDISIDIKIIHESSEQTWNDFLTEKMERAIDEKSGDIRGQLWAIYYRYKERFADIDYAYAITAHKSQGSTYEEVVLAMDDIIANPRVVERNRILYTSITRASKFLTVLNRYNK